MNELADILSRTYPGKEVLLVEEAAGYLGLSVSRVHALCSSRALAHYSTGRAVYIKKADLDAYMCSGERRAALSEAEAAIEGRRLAKMLKP